MPTSYVFKHVDFFLVITSTGVYYHQDCAIRPLQVLKVSYDECHMINNITLRPHRVR